MASIGTAVNSVTDTPAASPEIARAHFASLLQLETDCWDVHEMLGTSSPGFVLLDIRSPQMYAAAHIEQAINLPYGRINERNLESYPADTLFVVYCDGPHCNGADRGALRLASLGRKVKKMLGGIEGWKVSGFPLAGSRT